MKRLVFSALFLAFGLVLPMLFHAAGMAGPVFSPMHIPVLLAGLTLGPAAGFSVGLLTVLLSSLLTGMPPLTAPVFAMMMVELPVYGVVSGYLARRRLHVLVSLAAAMVAGRIAFGLAAMAVSLFMPLPVAPLTMVLGGVVSGLPGIVLHLIAVPLLAAALNRTPVGILAREEAQS